MWTSPCFNHTLPLGVTVALHQACLVAKKGSRFPWRSLSQGSRQAQRVQEGGDRPAEGGSSRICAHCGEISSLNTTRFGPSGRQRTGELTRTPLLWWMGGYEEAFFTCREHPSQFLLASNFYNSRDVTVGWFDSKIVIFLLQKCLGQNQLLTESLPQNGTGFPGGRGGGGRMFPPPCPGLSHPVCPWAAHCSRSQLAEAACCCFHTEARATRGMHVGRCGFFSFSSRDSRLTIYHD